MAIHLILLLLNGWVLTWVAGWNSNPGRCRNIPGDHAWPTETEWAAFNNTIQGRLISTIPQAKVCHLAPYESYNSSACTTLAHGWGLAQTL